MLGFKARDLSGLSPEVDINAVASVLKEYFRELPDTLIPADNQQEFIEAAMLQVRSHAVVYTMLKIVG